MEETPCPPALLYRINQNVMALGSAIEEIDIWIDQRGSAESQAESTSICKATLTLLLS
ncbi:hypothetical protein D3C84_1148360 [compost metagenome]